MALRRNLTIASLRTFFAMFMLVVPVLVPYWRSLGLSMHDVLELQAIFGLAVAIFEVPTGYLADLFTRKGSVVLGSFMTALSFSYLPFARTYNELLVFELVNAFGASLVSGAKDALVYESIPPEASRKKILGSFSQWGLVGEAVAAIVAGFLVLYSFSAVIWAQVAVGWVPFILSLLFVEPPRQKMSGGSHSGRFGEAVRAVLLSDPLTRLVFMNYVCWGLSTFCIVWLQQQYWTERGVPVSWFGVLWAALMLIAAAASRLAHVVEAKIGAHRMLMAIALLPVIGYLIMASSPALFGVSVGALFYVVRGFCGVVYGDAFNWRIPSAYRATANSMQSLFMRLGFAILGPILGLVVDSFGISSCFALLAALFLGCSVILAYPLVRRIDELHVGYIPPES